MTKTPHNYGFTDAQNLNLGIRSLGWKLDYKKAVIVTSDGDFYSLVRHLYALDKLEAVLSPSVHCSKLLRKGGKEKIVYMDNLKARLEFIRAK